MTREEFYTKFENRKYAEILDEFKRGLNLDIDIEEETNQASWSENFEALYLFWQMGAKGESPFIEEIFERFKNGESPQQLIDEKAENERAKRAAASADLTTFTTVQQIPLGEITMFAEEGLYFLSIEIKSYIFDDYVYDARNLIFGPINIQESKTEFTNDAFDESIYLFHSHNPIYLKSIELQNLNNLETQIKVELLFDFEFEVNGKNKSLVIEQKIPRFA
ncbi:MAG: hypothetical protein ACKOXB_09640 [Flavobacteriales bacterium]